MRKSVMFSHTLAASFAAPALIQNASHTKLISVHGKFNSSFTATSLKLRSFDSERVRHRKLACKASETSEASDKTETKSEDGNGAAKADDYPSGQLVFQNPNLWQVFLVKLRMLVAWPWQRVKKGSILKLKISGEITEELQGPFTQGISLPQLCENIVKAAHDPRISALIIQVEPFSGGWAKVDEISRYIDYYKQCGKPLAGYISVGGEKEYYLACSCGDIFAPPGAYISLLGLKVQAQFVGGVLEKVGVDPQVERIGKYKSAGDLLSRKDMSEANREMLTAILDDVYENWLHGIASRRGKTPADVERLLEEGIFEIEKLKLQGWISDVKYEDEIEAMLKEKLGMKKDKTPRYVDYRKYSRVKKWTLGLTGGKSDIAILRAVGSISRARSSLSVSSGGISSDVFVEQIRQVRDAKNIKAVVLRIDSPGGDALASDLMWRELKLLGEKKPVIASMVDVAASGGYYMAMAAGVVVAENLTLTGSIGVVTGKLNLGKLYERVGYTKEVISKGKFAELDADQRPFRPDEAEFFAKSARNAYNQFRDKAALSRSMEVDSMENVAQGRVWTGKAALTRGLVDTVGGFSKAVAIAKQKAGVSEETKVRLLEFSRRQPNVLGLLRRGALIIVSLPSFLEKLSAMNQRNLVQTLMEDIRIEGGSLSESFVQRLTIEGGLVEFLERLLR